MRRTYEDAIEDFAQELFNQEYTEWYEYEAHLKKCLALVQADIEAKFEELDSDEMARAQIAMENGRSA